MHPSFGRYTLTPPGDSPCARVGHSCSYLPPVDDAKRGKVFIVGGADPNRSFSDVHTMDLGKTSSGRACVYSLRAGLARTRAFLGTPVQNTAGFSFKERNITERSLRSQQSIQPIHHVLGRKNPCGALDIQPFIYQLFLRETSMTPPPLPSTYPINH